MQTVASGAPHVDLHSSHSGKEKVQASPTGDAVTPELL